MSIVQRALRPSSNEFLPVSCKCLFLMSFLNHRNYERICHFALPDISRCNDDLNEPLHEQRRRIQLHINREQSLIPAAPARCVRFTIVVLCHALGPVSGSGWSVPLKLLRLVAASDCSELHLHRPRWLWAGLPDHVT